MCCNIIINFPEGKIWVWVCFFPVRVPSRERAFLDYNKRCKGPNEGVEGIWRPRGMVYCTAEEKLDKCEAYFI